MGEGYAVIVEDEGAWEVCARGGCFTIAFASFEELAGSFGVPLPVHIEYPDNIFIPQIFAGTDVDIHY